MMLVLILIPVDASGLGIQVDGGEIGGTCKEEPVWEKMMSFRFQRVRREQIKVMFWEAWLRIKGESLEVETPQKK